MLSQKPRIVSNTGPWVLRLKQSNVDPGGVSVVGAVTKLRAGKSRIRNPTGSRDLAVLRNFQSGSGSHLSYSVGTGVLSPW